MKENEYPDLWQILPPEYWMLVSSIQSVKEVPVKEVFFHLLIQTHYKNSKIPTETTFLEDQRILSETHSP